MPKKKKIDPIPHIKKVVEKRSKPYSEKWQICYVQYEQREVYASLCSDLIAKFVRKSEAIKKIRWKEKEDGRQIVYVWYDEFYRATYHIEAF